MKIASQGLINIIFFFFLNCVSISNKCTNIIAWFSFYGLEVKTTVFGQMDTRTIILVRMMLVTEVANTHHFGERLTMCVDKSVCPPLK